MPCETDSGDAVLMATYYLSPRQIEIHGRYTNDGDDDDDDNDLFDTVKAYAGIYEGDRHTWTILDAHFLKSTPSYLPTHISHKPSPKHCFRHTKDYKTQ